MYFLLLILKKFLILLYILFINKVNFLKVFLNKTANLFLNKKAVFSI